MAKKKSTSGENRFLVLRGGRKLKLLGENGKYWICEGTQFRKNNPDVQGYEYAWPAKKPEAVEAPDGGCSGDSCPVVYPEDMTEDGVGLDL